MQNLKWNLSLVIIFTITGLFFIIPVYGSSISASVDRSTYQTGDTITVTGKVVPTEETPAIVLQIINPNNSDIVAADQFQPNNDGSFSKTYIADGPKWYSDGLYTLRVFYGEWLEITFEFQRQTNTSDDTQPNTVGSVDKPSYNPVPPTSKSQVKIPTWIKNNAAWWSNGLIADADFIEGIQYLIQNDIMKISGTVENVSEGYEEIPAWVRNNAAWWAGGFISEDDFVSGIKWLIEHGVIQVS